MTIMRIALLTTVATALITLLTTPRAPAQERFEIAAWVDHFDFAPVKRDGQYVFDTETAEGCEAILEHVEETGATTILWRNCGGGNMRYQTRIDSGHHPAIVDMRRIPDTREVLGWVRYREAEPDIIRHVVGMCDERGLVPGVHWPFEETHHHMWTIGQYNFEHPRYWGRTRDGRPWMGRCSLAYDDVVEHKLALVDELLERGVDALFIDFYRSGGWSPAYEYVDPIVEAYREQYGEEPPPPTDIRWCRHVAGYVTRFFERLRERLDASGRHVELMVGVPAIAPIDDWAITNRAADWQTWVDRGIIDALVINFVRWDRDRPFESTRELCGEVMDVVDGRCRVLWPVRAYNYGDYGMPDYAEVTGLAQEEIAGRLMQMAWEEGAAGVSLECVDYGNYHEATRERMRTLAEGPCRWVREQ